MFQHCSNQYTNPFSRYLVLLLRLLLLIAYLAGFNNVYFIEHFLIIYSFAKIYKFVNIHLIIQLVMFKIVACCSILNILLYINIHHFVSIPFYGGNGRNSN